MMETFKNECSDLNICEYATSVMQVPSAAAPVISSGIHEVGNSPADPMISGQPPVTVTISITLSVGTPIHDNSPASSAVILKKVEVPALLIIEDHLITAQTLRSAPKTAGNQSMSVGMEHSEYATYARSSSDSAPRYTRGPSPESACRASPSRAYSDTPMRAVNASPTTSVSGDVTEYAWLWQKNKGRRGRRGWRGASREGYGAPRPGAGGEERGMWVAIKLRCNAKVKELSSGLR
ncbi:uncharacterized protein BXZ73DRAFT_81859 [Epithele typhae]|uniref:uncharacterized protein n=1 Tax=Epithele typhae TaxID=378194 RepID=UPI002007D77C|nr:uncharacterized protein BXZ73DRAFT_81859 [Epithele typhae]KAH9913682.1 hypothetical protein BXZ73DRAFT_81859 [Epithele typhae]